MVHNHGEVLQWLVIGAGPAGIATVGKLLDQGIKGNQIGWIDPLFTVGDLGEKWYNVSSNTKVELFTRFLKDCSAFDYQHRPHQFLLDTLNPEHTCRLKDIADPLRWVTSRLRDKVSSFVTRAVGLNLHNHQWEVTTEHQPFYAHNVVLAVGSDAKNLAYSKIKMIPLEVALNMDRLSKAIQPGDTIGVFGSSHSAILILANLHELNAQIINFYRSPHHYAIYLDDWILFDNTGLKGYAADWAKQHLDGKMPSNLRRVLTTDHTFEEALAECQQVVYAVGFDRRKTPVLEQYERMQYQERTGIIAPGLFGVGIAFPQAQLDPMGNLEYRVGLWKFMNYLNTILPIWLKYANKFKDGNFFVNGS